MEVPFTVLWPLKASSAFFRTHLCSEKVGSIVWSPRMEDGIKAEL